MSQYPPQNSYGQQQYAPPQPGYGYPPPQPQPIYIQAPPPQQAPEKERGCLYGWYGSPLSPRSLPSPDVLTDARTAWPRSAAAGFAARPASAAWNA
ncbi:hypothetical protein B2J93_593 [Marssonina coronariae]|uniref:Uncharacterized protein n=1 Tax=Diplocarpon coronariae TaxID=2795749 RepID=A0A218ZBY7_9HELO|nr:hypothetical protein B2J93_593 [Marssonina coronariae]